MMMTPFACSLSEVSTPCNFEACPEYGEPGPASSFLNPATPDFKNKAAERGVALAAMSWLLLPLLLAAIVMISSWMAFKQLTTASSSSKSDLAGSIRVHRAQPVGNVGLIFTDLSVTVGGHNNEKASRCTHALVL